MLFWQHVYALNPKVFSKTLGFNAYFPPFVTVFEVNLEDILHSL